MTDPSLSGTFTDAALDAGAKHLPARMGCICLWDEDGNPPPSCDCAERSQRLAREQVRQIVAAVLEAHHS